MEGGWGGNNGQRHEDRFCLCINVHASKQQDGMCAWMPCAVLYYTVLYVCRYLDMYVCRYVCIHIRMHECMDVCT